MILKDLEIRKINVITIIEVFFLFALMAVLNVDILSYNISDDGNKWVFCLTFLMISFCLAAADISRRSKNFCKSRALIDVFLVSIIVLSFLFGLLIRYIQVNESEKRGDAIIAALNAYKEKEGKFPEKLTSLVPEYLKEIPSPAIGIFTSSNFRFRKFPKGPGSGSTIPSQRGSW